MRRTALALMSLARAIRSAVQWVVSVGGSANVSATTRSATSGPNRGIREGRVLSRKRPSTPSSMNRCCQRQTQVLEVPVRRMISLVPTSSALRSKMAARQACFCEALRSLDGAMDGPTFIAYVEQVLTPTLKKGDVVFMDNLRTHKVDGVRQAIEAVGASVRYLPAYSPDLNPIEQAFSKLKTATRKGAARTVKALWKLIGRLIKTFAPEQCVNYFRHAGYGR
jgi:transposase